MFIGDRKYMTVKEYADKKHVTVQSVYQKIKRANLGSKKIGSLTLVEVA